MLKPTVPLHNKPHKYQHGKQVISPQIVYLYSKNMFISKAYHLF